MLSTIGDKLDLSGIIYLRTAPETCYGRLQKRGRNEESSVSLDYLTSLHERHEDWLIEKKKSLKLHPSLENTPILVLDCDEDFEHNPKVRLVLGA